MSLDVGAKQKEGGVAETVRVIFHALIIALVIRTFLFQPFNIPSGSMKETLLVGDYLFVSKYSLRIQQVFVRRSRRPLFSGRIWSGTPDRGDIVVFRLPKDDSTDYIKRVIGLPGDRIQMIEGLLHINGEPVKRERIEDFVDDRGRRRTTRVKRWRETLPNGVSYTTLDLIDNGFYDNTPVYVVPPGQLLHDGRQSRQLHRQPRAEPGRLRAARRISSARRRSSSSRSTKASAPGRSGAGPGRYAGAGCSRWCDEPQAQRPACHFGDRANRCRSHRWPAAARHRRSLEPKRDQA